MLIRFRGDSPGTLRYILTDSGPGAREMHGFLNEHPGVFDPDEVRILEQIPVEFTYNLRA
jgi:hypothetical protein